MRGEPRSPHLESRCVTPRVVLEPQASCGAATTQPTCRSQPRAWGMGPFPHALIMAMLILDTVKGGVLSTSSQQTESKMDTNDTKEPSEVRPGGNTGCLGLRFAQIREAVVFDKADEQASHFTSTGSFSGFGDGWMERLCHICKINSPMPSALATLPLTMLAICSQKQPVCLDRSLCRGEVGSFRWVSSARVASCVSGRICVPKLSSCSLPPSPDCRSSGVPRGAEDQGSEGPRYDASLQLRRGAL